MISFFTNIASFPRMRVGGRKRNTTRPANASQGRGFTRLSFVQLWSKRVLPIAFGCFAFTHFVAVAPAEDWKLVWHDEFEQEGPPDPRKWGFERGFVRNREAQYYTVNRTANAIVQGGHLHIIARRENYQPDGDKRPPKPVHYTSASLTTEQQATWTSGRIEVRAKLPKGRGTWPAIWLLGSGLRKVGWPKCGEIDIMEQVGFEPTKIHAHIHTERFNWVKGTDKGAEIEVEDADSAFHIYRVDWRQDRLDFFVDDKQYFTYQRTNQEGAWPFDQPHYLILNLAIGGDWGGKHGIDDSIFPCEYLIDYVRVYQEK